MANIRIAIVGVGNCAASLVPGPKLVRRPNEAETIPGLMQFTDEVARRMLADFIAGEPV